MIATCLKKEDDAECSKTLEAGAQNLGSHCTNENFARS